MIRVLLVDDQKLLIEGIQVLLEAHPDMQVVGTAANGVEAVELAQRLTPDVILMDIRMPVMDGVAATREIHICCPTIRIIILTTFDDDEYVFEGLRAGALGYLLKTISSDEIATAIRTVAAGGALIAPSITRKVVAEFSRVTKNPSSPPEHVEPLTKREHDVLRALASGLSNASIAESLGISEGTAKNHVSNVLNKLCARTRTQAILRAQSLKLL